MSGSISNDEPSDIYDISGDSQSHPSTQRRIPSFKLLDNDYASSKRLRNKAPSLPGCDGRLGDALGTNDHVIEEDKEGIKRASCSLSTAWDSAGSDFFGFGSESINEDEDIHRLDDTTLDYLAFFGIGNTDDLTLPLAEEADASDKRSQLISHDKKRSANQNYESDSSVGSQNHDSTVTDITTMDHLPRDSLDESAFDPDGRLPSFSVPIEALINRQLEAAERTLNGRINDDGNNSGTISKTFPSTLVPDNPGVFSLLALDSPPYDTAKQGKDVSIYQGDQGIQNVPFLELPSSDQERGEDLKSRGDSEEVPFSLDEMKPPKNERSHTEGLHGDEVRQVRTGRRKRGVLRTTKGRGRRAKVVGIGADASSRGGKGTSSRGSGVSPAKRQTSEDVAARLPLEVLECFYHVPLNVAAQELNVSLTMLKKLCRAYGVKRWPHRQVSSLDKTIARLQDKIAARGGNGKDAPNLTRKLEQGMKRRSVIIKTASAGLDADVLNTIFTSRPGEMDEDLLLQSSNVAEAVGKLQTRRHRREVNQEDEVRQDGGKCQQDEAAQSPAQTRAPTGRRSSLERPAAKNAQRSPPTTPSVTAKRVGSSASGIPEACARGSVRTDKSHGHQLSTGTSRGVIAASKGRRGATSGGLFAGGSRATRSTVAATAAAAAAAATATEAKAGSMSVDPATSSDSEESASESVVTTMADSPSASEPRTSSSPSERRSNPGGAAPIAGYSSMFGAGSCPASAACAAWYGGGGGFEGEGAADCAGDAGAPLPTTAHIVAWGGAMSDGATALGEWQAPQYPMVSPIQRLAESPTDSPTVTATTDSFSNSLQLDSPVPLGTPLGTPLPSPLSPQQKYQPYFEQHQQHQQQHQQRFSHNPYACQPLPWFQGRFPAFQHPAYGFPLEAMSPIDTRRMQGHEQRHAFGMMPNPSAEDCKAGATSSGTKPAARAREICGVVGDKRGCPSKAVTGGAEDSGCCSAADHGAKGSCANFIDVVPLSAQTTGGGSIAVAAGVRPSPSQKRSIPFSADAPPRRTGFMSYLLHQSQDNNAPVSRST